MKKIRVHDFTGELCMTYEEGQALLELLRSAVDAGGADLDFTGTRLHMPPFFNAGITALLEDYTLPELRSRLVIRNLPAHAVETLKRCLENGDPYYHDPAYQKALDKVPDDQAACV